MINLARSTNIEKCSHTFLIFTYLIAIFPLLPFGIRSIVTVLWALAGVLYFLFNDQRPKDIFSSENILPITLAVLPYFFLFFSLSYSDDIGYGTKKLSQMLSLIIFPFGFFLTQGIFSEKTLNKVTIVFCLSVVLLVFYQYILVGLNYQELFGPLTEQEIKRNNLHHLNSITKDQLNQVKLRRFRSFIIEKVGSHPTYQGLWIAFAIYFLGLTLFKKRTKRAIFLLGILLMIILTFWMILLSARGPILMSISSFFICLLLFSKLSKKSYILLFLGFSIFFSSVYYFSEKVQTKTREISENLFLLPSRGNDIYNFNSTNVRNGIYYCSFITIKENWVIGVGIGDAQEILNQCYTEKIGSKIFSWHNFNTHNQYSFFILTTGVFGLIAFLVLLYIGLKKSFAEKNKLLFFFFILISLSMLTENVISRSDGMLFFSLFFNIALFGQKSKLD